MVYKHVAYYNFYLAINLIAIVPVSLRYNN